MNFSNVDLTLYGGHDPRLQPIYSVAQAARLSGVASSTLRSWVVGRPYPTQSGDRFFAPIIKPPSDKWGRISFVNVIEAHVLAALRREHQLRLDKVRPALEYVQRELQTPHPLATRVFETDGIDLFVRHFAEIVNASRDGQIAMRELLEARLRRVEHDQSGQAFQLFPFVSRHRDESSLQARLEAPRSVVVNPFLSFGKPILARKGIAVWVIADRFKAGESVEEIAYDLDCEKPFIEDALRYSQIAA